MPEESKLAEKLQEKESEVKFTEEELKKVQNFQQNYSNIQNQFGQLKMAQIRLDEQEIELEETLKNIQSKEKKFLDGITEKYGEGTISLESGEFLPKK